MPPKGSSKKAKTRLTARKRSASRSRCPGPRKKPALRLTDRMEAYSGSENYSEDELDAFPEHDKSASLNDWRVSLDDRRVSSNDRNSPSQRGAMGRTATLLTRPAAQGQPHSDPSPPWTPCPRTRADWPARDSSDGLTLYAPSTPSRSPQTDARLFTVDALDPADDQDPLDNAFFGMHDYAAEFHAKGLRTRADYVNFVLDCLVKPNIVHDSLAEMFPTVPGCKLRPLSWVLCRKVCEELKQNTRDVERMLCEAAGEISDGDEQSGDVHEEDYTSGMDSVDEVQALLEDLVDEMEGEEEEG
ncbi:hypothetical protein K523DRAFT_333682 [Schizophyllum commune Tattone D]|nr:hypothetical protein K523DRAFT_333682 [Schizophyllum commune Tattone D]